jgi:endo-1,4-beta-D-glucanase Y
MKKYVGYLLILVGAAIIIVVLYRNSQFSVKTRVFSPYTMLTSSWAVYKSEYINKDGRVVDYSQNNITTSEGQSYAMLRAVWMDDKSGFDFVWQWTKTNLQKRSDKLFGWKWGQNGKNTYGFLHNGGNNSASDADSDIALALIMAGKRWQNNTYTNEAKNILPDLWNAETATVSGKTYMIAGNWAKDDNRIIINPSYFSPYAWRIFARIDKEHDWNSLIKPAYELLNNAGSAPLDKENGSGLPPDWLAINSKNGELTAANMQNLRTDYSYDALRTPWRIALDYQWNKNEEAKTYLLHNYTILSRLYSDVGYLPTTISHSGDIVDTKENPAMYAASLGYFMLADKNISEKIYQEKVLRLYSNDQNGFKKEIPYYEQNWLWFGAALYNNSLQSFF